MKSLLFGVAFFVLAFSGFGQNTKGDRPFSNQEQVREAKSRLKTKKRATRSNANAQRRIQSSTGSSSSRANNNVFPQPNTYAGRKSKSSDRPAKPISPIFNAPPDESRSKAWKGDIYGNRIRKNTQTAREAKKKRNIYPQPEPYRKYLSKKSKNGEKPWKGDFQGAAIIRRYPKTDQKPYTGPLEKSSSNLSRTGRIKNDFKYQNESKKTTAKKLKKEPKAALTTASGDLPIRMFPRQSENIRASQLPSNNAYSASHSFIVRRKKNVYWGKFRRKEKAYTRDLAGLKLRRKNYASTLPPLTNQDRLVNTNPHAKDKASLGGQLGSDPGKRDNAWIGDPNGSKIRKPKPKNTEIVGSNKYLSRGSYSKNSAKNNRSIGGNGWQSISGSNGVSKPLPPRVLSNQGYSFTGNVRSKYDKSFDPSAASFRGNIKRGRPLKGGGSISGNTWNNKNRAITEKLAIGHDISHSYGGFIKGTYARPAYGKQGADFSGKIKFVKPATGGGSVSGTIWNNSQKSITRTRPHAYQGFDFAGDIKTIKLKKGGGSVSGKVWNNLEEPITRQRNHAYQGFDFAGDLKATKPKKGGESISGQSWNNNEKPLPGTYAKNPRISVATSGKIPLSKFRSNYIQNPKASILSIKKRRPSNGALAVNGFKSKMKQGDYQRKPKASEVALLGLGPAKNTVRASAFGGKTKLSRDYVHNPKSAALALKVLSQPKAYAKIGDYQGNMKMRKATGKKLHPDAKFAHLGQSNIKSDRTIFTNIKLIWAKMFKKGENQPEAAKPNNHPLRYDRKEKDLWKALYDYNDLKK